MPESRIDSAKVLVLCKAAAATRGGAWVSGAPTHVFAEFLSALERDGWTLAARVGTEDELSSLLARLEGFLCKRRRESPEHAFLYREVKTALAARAAPIPEEKVYEIERDRFGLHFSGPALANGECVRVRLVDVPAAGRAASTPEEGA